MRELGSKFDRMSDFERALVFEVIDLTLDLMQKCISDKARLREIWNNLKKRQPDSESFYKMSQTFLERAKLKEYYELCEVVLPFIEEAKKEAELKAEPKRLCHEVIKQILEKVPVDRTEFITDLSWNYEDSLYKAPEETLQWERTMQTLKKHIPFPVKEWEFEVLSIFTTLSVEKLKAYVILM